jgi:hypothetical protein
MSCDDESSGGDFFLIKVVTDFEKNGSHMGEGRRHFFFEEMMTYGTMIDLIKGS